MSETTTEPPKKKTGRPRVYPTHEEYLAHKRESERERARARRGGTDPGPVGRPRKYATPEESKAAWAAATKRSHERLRRERISTAVHGHLSSTAVHAHFSPTTV